MLAMKLTRSRSLVFAVIFSSIITSMLLAATNGISFYINGKADKAQAIERDGVIYIPAQAVAKALGMKFRYDRAKKAIYIGETNEKAAQKQVAPPSVANGSIKGTVTYYFNDNYGAKPDVGADVWLLKGVVAVSDEDEMMSLGNQINIYLSSGTEKVVQSYRHTIVDGSGNYSFTDVPPGQYTVLMRSRNTNGANKRDMIGKWVCLMADVESGKTTDISHDFGTSAL